jgi:hypothetical protein
MDMADYIEQINQLLDGDLDQMHEAKLYGELAVNADLRSEMREQLAIKGAVQDDRMALVPPVSLTSSVFSGLGFAAPLAGAAAGAAGGSMLLQWLTRLGIPILSAIAAVGVTVGVSNQREDRPRVVSQEAITGEQATVTPEVLADEPPSTVTSEAPAPSPRTVTVFRDDPAIRAQLEEARAENAVLRRDLADARRVQQPVPEPPSREVVTPPADRTLPMISTIQMNNTVDVHMTSDRTALRQRAFALDQIASPSPQWIVQLRGMSLTPTTSTIAPEQNAWYNDLSGAFLRFLSPNHAFGLEVGNETYPMVFNALENGQDIRYEQYPAAMWGGITYRYTGNTFGNLPIAPFGQGMVGGSTYGPMARLSGGLQYTPAGPLMFLVGIEGSILAYPFQNTWYVSPKYGLTYGIALKL